MLTIFFLIAISIFIPPFWFVTLGYISYLIATKKQRRDKVIMHEIRQSIAQKRGPTLLDHLYFDSAKSFVIDLGAATNDLSEDRLDIELNIDGKNYQIMLQRQENEETLLSVCVAENAVNVEQNQKNIVAEVPLLFKDSA